MELHTATTSKLDSYWQAFFACACTNFDAPQTLVVPHAELGEYHGILLFRRQQTLIISVPSTFPSAHRAELGTMTIADVDDRATLYTRVSVPIEHLIGPAFIGYADARTFQPYHAGSVRLLTPHDEAAFHRFRASCPPMEWEHGGSSFGEHQLAGYFIANELAALAGYELWGTTIAHIAVVTHPQHRGRGYGKGVVSFLSAIILRNHRIPQYRTLCSNTPSIQLAAALGFAAYAESLAVRLV